MICHATLTVISAIAAVLLGMATNLEPFCAVSGPQHLTSGSPDPDFRTWNLCDCEHPCILSAVYLSVLTMAAWCFIVTLVLCQVWLLFAATDDLLPSSRPSAKPTPKPSAKPSARPTLHPTAPPTTHPSSVPPTANPSVGPTPDPSALPTLNPSALPTPNPSTLPTPNPSAVPTPNPTADPTPHPSANPSADPSHYPTGQPSGTPTALPSSVPSSRPSGRPISKPTSQPSGSPTSQPSSSPTGRPTRQPTSRPTGQPTTSPTGRPTGQPTVRPSARPSRQPTAQPTTFPTGQPTSNPSTQPTAVPTAQPTDTPSAQPSGLPSAQPTSLPSVRPTVQPSAQPSAQPVLNPTTVPTGQPSALPTGQPTSQPTEWPTSAPLAHPTSQPSSQPTAVPTGEPTAQPSAAPSSQPTSIPSLQPSSRPTAQPSSYPSAQPSSVPSGQPSTQPSSVPTTQPSAAPTGEPTSQPTSTPSSQPTSIPTSEPTAQPSSAPSSQPTSVPSAQPTAQPSECPSGMPVSTPTSRPTDQPTTQPSAQPSGRPVAAPTSQPSAQPSAAPTAQPTSLPTSQPSSRPTSAPTGQPSAAPTAQPSARPTGQPSARPSTTPSAQPTSAPTGQPSGQPSSQPSAQPFAAPTSQPTSQPTTFRSTRVYECRFGNKCERQTDTTCSYFTPSAILLCEDADTPCTINTGTFTVGPNSTVTVSGGCELVVQATGTVSIQKNSTVRGAALTLTAGSDMHITGVLTTSSQGPLDGPGAPTHQGDGATYGGSGGNLACQQQYFTASSQIGSINVFEDLNATSPHSAATYGSGGGVDGAGRGGGRIVLQATGTVYIQSTGRIEASGGSANSTSFGAGSGGSVSIRATTVSQLGWIEANGGEALAADVTAGAAGGGGRIAMSIFNGNVFNLFRSKISYRGGASPMVDAQRLCAVGGAGTLFIEQRSASSLSSAVKVAAIAVSNGNLQTFAVTSLQILPKKTTGIAAYDMAVLSSNGTIKLPSLTHCSEAAIGTPACSFIYLQDATMVSLRNSTVDVETVVGTIEVTSLAADYIYLNASSITGPRFVPYTVMISAREFALSQTSSMDFTADFNIFTAYHTTILGTVTQKPYKFDAVTQEAIYAPRGRMHVVADGNATFGTIIAGNLVVDAVTIDFQPNALIMKPPDMTTSSCIVNITQTARACNDYRYTRSLQQNNTYVFVGNTSVSLAGPTKIQASAVLICAPYVNVEYGAIVNADYRGCRNNQGFGAGGMQSSTLVSAPSGGGGGGYGGIGGNGYAVTNFGLAYVDEHSLSSGGGGGCYACNDSYNSYGGGIVNIVANTSLHMNGLLTADGAPGLNGAGGGAGGTISINALAMYGKGNISARGGAGGTGLYPGGGGGGGVVSLSNYMHSFERFSYTGYYRVSGGPAGAQTTTLMTALDGQARKADNLQWQQAGLEGDELDLTWLPRRSLRSFLVTDTASPATAGAEGKAFLPTCPAGTGNDPATGAVCEACPPGTYSLGGSADACLNCDNAPSHSHYLGVGGSDPDCPYECDAGYATNHCYNQIQNFIYNIMGVPAFTGMCLGFFLVLMLPLTYQRLKRRYGWFQDDAKFLNKKKKRDLFGLDFFARNADDDDEILDSSHGKGDKLVKMQKFKTENPIVAATDLSRMSTDSQVQTTRIRTMRNQMFAERRREYRMNDQDLMFHAHRVNLLGSNNPFKSRGGPWRMPLSRPACLRPMLKREEYRQFAQRINDRMGWTLFSWEAVAFFVITLLAPPLSSYLMGQFRRRRTKALLKIVATYDHACFRCSRQREAQNSLRIGISPDCTLAYIDFLFDEDYFRARARPLCPIGQVKLPATFKFAGLGTYFSPYFIDTNDLILQAVPQTDIPSYFINTAWIRFVVELNTVLRSVQADYLHLGVHKLTRFLSNEQHIVDLGGLVVEFCTFSNNEKTSPYDEKRERETAQQHTVNPTISDLSSVPVSSPSTTTGIGTEVSGMPRATDAGGDSPERLDSFGFNTGARKSEDGGNWLADFVDFSNWGTARRAAKKSAPSAPVEIEMRDSSFKAPQPPSIISRSSTSSAAGKGQGDGARLVSARNMQPTGIAGFFMGWYDFVQDRIAQFFASGYTMEDPAGKSLSFHEMCNAIQEGNLTMGIIVTHSKIDGNNYIVQDDDYESEDEEFYEEEIFPVVTKGHGSLRMLHLSRSADSAEAEEEGSSEEERRRRAAPAAREASDSETDGSSASPSRTASNATDMSTSLGLARVYGSKAEEMQRFYNIMLNAEASSKDSSSQPSTPGAPGQEGGTAPTDQPKRQSRRASALPAVGGPNPLRTTATAARAQRRASALPATPSTSVTTAAPSGTAPAAPDVVAVTATAPPATGPEPEETPSAPEPAQVPPVADDSPQMTSFGRKSRSRSRTRSRSGTGTGSGSSSDEDGGWALPRKPRTSRTNSVSRSHTRSASPEPISGAGAATSMHPMEDDASDDAASEHSAGPRLDGERGKGRVAVVVETIEARLKSSDRSPESGSSRKRSGDSSSEVSDTGGIEDASEPPTEPVPPVDDSQSVGPSDEEDQPPAAVEEKGTAPRPTSMRFSDFRHSEASGGGGSNEGSGDEDNVKAGSATEDGSPVPAALIPAEESSRRRPVLQRGDSTKSVSPMDRRTSEYTEFRPTERVRKTTFSDIAGGADLDRFSDFRHSDIYPDRDSECMPPSLRPRSTKASGALRYSTEEEDEEVDDYEPAARPTDVDEAAGEAPSLYERDSSVVDTGAEAATPPPRLPHLSVPRLPKPASVRETDKARRKSTKKPSSGSGKTKRGKRKRAQRDLSGLNLAPSAHQQEFNTWRLLPNSPVPVSDRGGLNGRPISNAVRMSLAAGMAMGGHSPMHMVGEPSTNRDSVMADRSSMITSADDRVAHMEEGVTSFENPLSKHRSNQRTASTTPVNVSDRGRVVSLAREDLRSSYGGGASSRGRRPISDDYTGAKLDFGRESRFSEASTIADDASAPLPVAVAAQKTIEQTFKAIYSTRVVFMFISRFMFGGNVYPLGPRSVRKVLEAILLILSLADMALGSIICFEYYCVSENATSCQDHTDLALVVFLWPFAMVIAPLMGVCAVMLGPSGTLTRIYAMWNRLTGVNNLVILIVYFRYFNYFTSLAITTYPPILYTCTRGLSCLIVDQYIAHIEKLRYTRGWDGLHTSLFKTQDSKTVITDGK